MAITINLYYSGKNGSARKFAEEMLHSGTVADIRAEEAKALKPGTKVKVTGTKAEWSGGRT